MASEGGMNELKIGSGRKMTKTKSPKVLWDDCLELKSYIHSNTSLDFFNLDGMTPNTKILGEKFDITTFCKFDRYQWVYFRDTYVTFLETSWSLEGTVGEVLMLYLHSMTIFL